MSTANLLKINVKEVLPEKIYIPVEKKATTKTKMEIMNLVQKMPVHFKPASIEQIKIQPQPPKTKKKKNLCTQFDESIKSRNKRVQKCCTNALRKLTDYS